MCGLRHLLLSPDGIATGVCRSPPGARGATQGWLCVACGSIWASGNPARFGRAWSGQSSSDSLTRGNLVMRAIDYFDKGAEGNLDRTAIIDADASWSYREMQAATQDIARALCASGLRDQEPAGIYSHNDARVLFCMLGIMRAGAVWVPINYRNAIDANLEYMNYVEMAWLFYHSRFHDTVIEIKRRVPSLRGMICLDREDGDHPSLDAFMEQGTATEIPDWGDAYGNPDRLAGLVPTGGTTGPAKGVRVTSLSWGTMTEMASHYWRSEGCDPVCLSVAPLSHAAGVVAFTMLTLGATNLVMPGFDALEVLRNIERFCVTHLFLPPTAFYGLLAHPDVRKFDYSSLRVFLLAASPVSPDKLKLGVEIFGPCMCQSYGQTEAPMLMTFLDQKTVAAAAAGDHPERLRSCGKPTCCHPASPAKSSRAVRSSAPDITKWRRPQPKFTHTVGITPETSATATQKDIFISSIAKRT